MWKLFCSKIILPNCAHTCLDNQQSADLFFPNCSYICFDNQLISAKLCSHYICFDNQMILMCQQASLNTLDVPYEHTELKWRILDLDFSWITSVKQVFFRKLFFLLVLSLKITCLLHVPLHASMNFRNGFELIRRHYFPGNE